MVNENQEPDAGFDREVARIAASGALGQRGRLLELFTYFASRGPGAEPASQVELAESVFGTAPAETDDATARVYVHRLRKRLDEFYAREGEGADGFRLEIPAGTYALRVRGRDRSGRVRWHRALGKPVFLIVAAASVAAIASFGLARFAWPVAPAADAGIWQEFLDSPRPITVVVGDYYIFAETAPGSDVQDRLVREFGIESATDLVRAQQTKSDLANAHDIGLTYLPVSSVYGLRAALPVLSRHPRPLRILPASRLTSEMLRDSNVVYVGLFSGMGLLEETAFDGSSLDIGVSYDELVDRKDRRTYVSDERSDLASPRFYRDYGYISVFRAASGNLVGIVAGTRDTGLRGAAQIATPGGAEPPTAQSLANAPGQTTGWEALYAIAGQQGTDLDTELLVVRARSF